MDRQIAWEVLSVRTGVLACDRGVGSNSVLAAAEIELATSSATGGPCHIRNKDAEATKQQYSARRQLKIRHEGRKNARQYDHRKTHQRKRAVIDKQPDQFTKHRDQHVHDKAFMRGRRKNATDANPTIRNRTANPTIARSAPGHATPRPSPVQKRPNADSMTPTANLSVFSGTRASGRCTTKPTPATSRHAATAPALAGTSVPRPALRAITMNTTSSPSRSTALKLASAASQSSRALVTAGLLAQFRRFGRECR